MKYAIDRYEMGLEKEVSADIFYNKYIPRKKDQYFGVPEEVHSRTSFRITTRPNRPRNVINEWTGAQD